MAQISIILKTTFTPAYDALVAVAHEIAAAQGEDRALAFIQSALDADFEAFIVLSTERTRPALRLVHSAA